MIHTTTKQVRHERRREFWREIQSLCVCAFEDEADLRYAQAVEFVRYKVQSLGILYVCSAAAKNSSGTVQNLDR